MALPAIRTVSETAKYLDCAYGTVLKHIATGALRARKVGKGYAVTEEAITEFLTGRSVATSNGRPDRASGRRQVTRGAA